MVEPRIHLIRRGVSSVPGQPYSFSVGGVIASSKPVLCPLEDNWEAVVDERVHRGVLEKLDSQSRWLTERLTTGSRTEDAKRG